MRFHLTSGGRRTKFPLVPRSNLSAAPGVRHNEGVIMSEEKPEIIKLNCPVCKSQHDYSVKITKSYVFYHMTPDMDTSTQFVKVRRVFTCPKEDKEFQATLKIPQHFGELIDGVEVQK